MNKKPLGTPVRSSFERNCLQCARWITCRNPDKNFDFACSKFNSEFNMSAKLRFEEEQDEARSFTKTKNGILLPKTQLSTGLNTPALVSNYNSNIQVVDDEEDDNPNHELSAIINKVLRSGVPVPPDLRIDNDGLPRPYNIVDWMTKPEFIGGEERPFGKQIQMGAHFFSDWCPVCSDEDYFECVPVNDREDDIRERVVFLHNGRCPQCKRNKLQLINKYDLKDPTELVAILGQRCLSGDTRINTNKGTLTIKEIVGDIPYGYSDYTGNVELFRENNILVHPEKVYRAKPEPLYKITLSDGRELKGTKDHPIYTQKGFVTLGNLTTDKHAVRLHTLDGFQGTERHLDRNITNLAKYLDTSKAEGLNILARLVGLYVSEGVFSKNSVSISNHDVKINSFLAQHLPKLGNCRISKHMIFLKLRKNRKRATLLKAFGGTKLYSRQRFIPDWIFYASKSAVWEFISGLYDGDGWAGSGGIHYSSTSELLVRQLQSLLTHMGVASTLKIGKTYKSKNGSAFLDNKEDRFKSTIRTCYSIKIEDKNSTDIFLNNVEFLSDKSIGLTKRRKIIELQVKKHSYALTDHLPEPCYKQYIKFCNEVDVFLRQYRSQAYMNDSTHFSCGSRSFRGEFGRIRTKVKGIFANPTRNSIIKKIGLILKSPLLHLFPNELKRKLLRIHELYCTNNTYWVSITKIEVIEAEDTYDFTIPGHHRFISNGILSHNSGKTISSTMYESYNIMRWLTTPNLPATYGILSSTILTATYTATTFNQAKENFWNPFDVLISNSSWYKEYHAFLSEVGRKFGEELYKHSETMITYKHKNIFASPATPSMRSLRGRTRISGVVDEGGWYRSGKKKDGQEFERMNGQEVYTALKRSLTTIRAAYLKRRNAGNFNIPKPLMTLISSPSARNDLIMTRYRESNGSPDVYSIKAPTWEVNPEVTREVLAEEFRVRPIESLRDYGCEPPMAMNAWISDESLVEGSFGDRRNCVITKARRIRTKSKKLATAAEYKLVRTPNYEYGAVMAIDAGWNQNSFAIAVGYPTTIPDAEDDDDEDVFVGIEIAALVEIIPKKTHPISFTRVYNDVIKPMCEEFNVACVVSDRWQNKKIVQDLEDALGIDYFELKATINDYDDYKQCLYDEMIVHPRLDMPFDQITNMTLDDYPDCFQKYPVAHLAFQMLTVQNSGTAVVKGEDGTTDDLLRTCILAHSALQDEEILEICLEYTNDTPQVRPGVAAIATASNRGAGTSSLNNFGVLMTRSTGGGATNSNITSIGVRAGRK